MRVVFSLLLFLTSCAPIAAEEALPDASGTSFRIATYNVNFGLAGDTDTLAAVVTTGADILCLQETSREWESALEPVASSEYPHRLFHHSRGAGGLAVLSRFPLREAKLVDGPDGWFPAWHMVAEAPGGPVQLLVVHLRPPVSDGGSYVWGLLESPEVHMKELAVFRRELDPELPTVILGDFNEGETGAVFEALEADGYRSALHTFQPEAVTWRWQTSLMPLQACFDHIMVGPRLSPIDADVLNRGRSDHLPVVATLRRDEPW